MKSHPSENTQTPGLVLGPLEKQDKTMKPICFGQFSITNYRKPSILKEERFFKGSQLEMF